MRLLPASVLGSCVLGLIGFVEVQAQLMRVTADGSLEHLENEDHAPKFLPAIVDVTFQFDAGATSVGPLVDESVKRYPATAAALRFGGTVMPLREAAFEISRGVEESLEWTSYLFTGETAAGWRFFLQNVFPSPTSSDALFPIVSPGELIVHAVTLSHDADGWAAYGDGVIRSVVAHPAPEPAAFGWAGAVLVGLLVVVRRAIRGGWGRASDEREA